MKSNNGCKSLAVEIENPSKYMTLTYAVSLTIIAILSGIVHIVLDRVIEQQSQTGKIVNISGQQRMLSQRASLFTINYMTTGSIEAKTEAQNSIAKMQKNYAFLVNPQRSEDFSAELHNLYFGEEKNVNSQLEAFISEIHIILGSPPLDPKLEIQIENLNFVQLAKSDLLQNLHAVVEQYEKESLMKVDNLRFAQNVVFWTIIFTIFVEAFFIFRPMVSKVSQFAGRLQYEANFDLLTGLLNRRAFDLLAKKSIASAKRYKQPLSAIICDIDFFKKVNDTYGHAAGDQVIKAVANIITNSARHSDVTVRFGGEEFILLLPQTDTEGAFLLAEKIRNTIESTEIKIAGHNITVTTSFGISQLIDNDEKVEDIIARGDKALYQSKDEGRNKTTIA